MEFGSIGDGVSDDTQAIRAAIAAMPDGGGLFFPAGRYRISDELIIERRINIKGEGYGSQIYQSATDRSLLLFQQACSLCERPAGLKLQGLYLGSAATQPGTSLIRLTNGLNNRIEDIIMLGAYYGIHLQGAWPVRHHRGQQHSHHHHIGNRHQSHRTGQPGANYHHRQRDGQYSRDWPDCSTDRGQGSQRQYRRRWPGYQPCQRHPVHGGSCKPMCRP